MSNSNNSSQDSDTGFSKIDLDASGKIASEALNKFTSRSNNASWGNVENQTDQMMQKGMKGFLSAVLTPVLVPYYLLTLPFEAIAHGVKKLFGSTDDFKPNIVKHFKDDIAGNFKKAHVHDLESRSARTEYANKKFYAPQAKKNIEKYNTNVAEIKNIKKALDLKTNDLSGMVAELATLKDSALSTTKAVTNRGVETQVQKTEQEVKHDQGRAKDISALMEKMTFMEKENQQCLAKLTTVFDRIAKHDKAKENVATYKNDIVLSNSDAKNFATSLAHKISGESKGRAA